MEACTGLTFVCLSRVKRLVDLIVEPMSFDRIGNLGNSLTMKARLQEEVRFVESLCPQGMGGGTYISLRCVGRSKAATGAL